MLNKLVVENLKHRPVRTVLSIMAIAVEVTMMLTIVGLSYGMLEDSQRRARGVGADVWIRPPGSAAIGLSSAPMSEKIIEFLEKQEHVAVASGSVSHPIGGVNTVTGLDYERFRKMSGGFKFLEGTPFRRSLTRSLLTTVTPGRIRFTLATPSAWLIATGRLSAWWNRANWRASSSR